MSYDTGWLAPDGTFIKCDVYDHIYVADKIVEDYGYQLSGFFPSDEILMHKGWVHITISMFMGHKFNIHWEKPLTDYQKNFLKPYFEQDYMPIGKITLMAWEEENK